MGERRADDCPSLLTADAVGKILSCSARTVYRLSDAGLMPPRVRVGSLVRWRRADIEGWIERGCPSARKTRSRKESP